MRAPTLAPVSCFLTLRTMLASAKNCHRLLRAQVATQKGHSRARAFRGVFVSRCDLRALVCRNPYRTAVVAAHLVCAIVRSVAAACRVVFTAHLRKRTIALRAADDLSVHRVCVPCCTVAEVG